MSVRVWLSIAGLAAGSAASLTAATLAPAAVEEIQALSPPAVLRARARAVQREYRQQLPRPAAPVTPVTRIPVVSSVAGTGGSRGCGLVVSKDPDKTVMQRYPYESIGEVKYLARVVMEDGGSVSAYLEQRCAEDTVLSVHVVNRARDLTDGWLNTHEYAASRALYRLEGIERSVRRADASALCTVEMGPHHTARLALLANDAILGTAHVTPAERTVTFVVKRSDLDIWIGTMELQVLEAGTNRPIVGAQVELELGGLNIGRVVPEQTTDRHGRVRLSHFPARARAEITAEGYRAGTTNLVVHGGGQVTTASVTLSPETVISGRVLGQDGRPANVRVSASRIAPGSGHPIRSLCGTGGGWKRLSQVSDPETGAFEIEVPIPGEYQLTLSSDGQMDARYTATPPLRVNTNYGSVRHADMVWIPSFEPVRSGDSVRPPTNPDGKFR